MSFTSFEKFVNFPIVLINPLSDYEAFSSYSLTCMHSIGERFKYSPS